MLEAPVYNMAGKQIDTMKIDEQVFGGEVRCDLIKQAVTAYHANTRQRTARTKSRSEIAYTRKKMFRQKGTGSARRGSKSDPLLRGGAHTFAKRPVVKRVRMPQKMRKAALNSAILAKLMGNDLIIVDGLKMDEPKTSVIAEMLKKIGINRSCLLAMGEKDRTIYLSARNIPKLKVSPASDLNAMDVVNSRQMVTTVEAMEILSGRGQSDGE